MIYSSTKAFNVKQNFKNLISKENISQNRVFKVKPLTFLSLKGRKLTTDVRSVRHLLQFYDSQHVYTLTWLI